MKKIDFIKKYLPHLLFLPFFISFAQNELLYQNRGDRFGNWDIYCVDAKGKNLKRLTDSSIDETHPHWSPF